MSYIIIIIKLPENSGSLNDGVSETVTHEMKKQANYFFLYVIRNVRDINGRENVNWKRSHEGRKVI